MVCGLLQVHWLGNELLREKENRGGIERRTKDSLGVTSLN